MTCLANAIELRNITKRFGQVVANKSISLELHKGEILSLLGENGSGKTTLMNMLSGIYYPDEGQIFVDGKEVEIRSPKDAFDLHIGMIHQHFKLVDVFTAAENIILGLPGEPSRMLINRTDEINGLPLTTVKFHQLQLFRGTPLAAEYDAAPERFRFWSVEEYIDLFIEILRRLRPDIVVERFAGEAPPRFHHTEGWGLIRNETLLSMLDHRLEELDVRQGDLYHPRATANGVPQSDINGRGVTNFNASEK